MTWGRFGRVKCREGGSRSSLHRLDDVALSTMWDSLRGHSAAAVSCYLMPREPSVLGLVRNGMTSLAGSMYGGGRKTLRGSFDQDDEGLSLYPLFKYRIITECYRDVMAVALIQTTGPVWAIIACNTNNTGCS